jgi:hypothetical protein
MRAALSFPGDACYICSAARVSAYRCTSPEAWIVTKAVSDRIRLLTEAFDHTSHLDMHAFSPQAMAAEVERKLEIRTLGGAWRARNGKFTPESGPVAHVVSSPGSSR